MDKATLRREMLTRRMALEREPRDAAARGFAAQALAFLRQQEFKTLAGYAPIRGELDVWPLLEAVSAEGRAVCLPVMQSGNKVLCFRRWEPGTTLATNRYGIAEPSGDAEEIKPDVVLVPLLAYDTQGHRLGYGGGYYDATLTAHPQALSIGCAYDWQESASVIAHHAGDHPLHIVITNKNVIRFSF